MTTLSTLLALTAVLLLVPSTPRLRWERAYPAVELPPGRTVGTRPLAAVLLVGVAVAVFLLLVLVLGGPRGFVLATTAALVLATAARLALLRLRRTTAELTSRAVVECCSVLAANLRVGLVPTQALARAADGCPLLRPAHETLLLGGDPPAVWLRQAAEPGAGGLRELARAWQVANLTGASLTSTLEQVAAGQSADQALRSVVANELAAPRATGKLMAALPLLGVGMGYLLGGDPVGWLTAGVAGWACLLLGVVLACAGVLWIESLSGRVSVQG